MPWSDRYITCTEVFLSDPITFIIQGFQKKKFLTVKPIKTSNLGTPIQIFHSLITLSTLTINLVILFFCQPGYNWHIWIRHCSSPFGISVHKQKTLKFYFDILLLEDSNKFKRKKRLKQNPSATFKKIKK